MSEATKENSAPAQGWFPRLQKWWGERAAKNAGQQGKNAAKGDLKNRGVGRGSKLAADGLGQRLRDNKVSIFSVVLLLLLLATYFIVYWPKYRDFQEQERKIARIEQLNAEVTQKKEQLEQQTAALAKEDEQHQYLLSSFFSSKELDRLFGNISLWAEDYRLQIEKIQKPNDSSTKSSDTGINAVESIRPMQIDIELSGKFFDYLALRNEVLSIDKALSILNEEINVTSTGKVSVAFVMEVYIQDTRS